MKIALLCWTTCLYNDFLCEFLYYFVSGITSEVRLTRCLPQLSPWCSGFGGGWRCSSGPALSAGQVCGNPPWRQSVKFLHTQKKWSKLGLGVVCMCVSMYVCQEEGCQRAAPTCVSECVWARDWGGEKERERMEERSDISHVACSHIDAQGYTSTHTHTHLHRGGARFSDVNWVLLLKSIRTHFIGYSG